MATVAIRQALRLATAAQQQVLLAHGLEAQSL
jgi:hypothetical protein